MLGVMFDALRVFRRSPGPAATIVLSLAIGIGANAAMFSVAWALLARPLPYQDAERLVILWNRSPGLGISEDWFSTAQYFDIKSGGSGFEQVAIAIGANYNLTGDGNPERIGAIRMSSNLLPMLGVRPAAGRLFDAGDDAAGAPLKAVLGHGTWMRRYAGDPAVIGRTITLNGQGFEVIGVLPPGFDVPREVLPTLGGAEHAEIVLSLPLSADAARIRNREDFNILGRLAPGVRHEQAQAELDALTARLRQEHPDIYPAHGGLTFDIVPLHEQVVGDVRTSLIVLIAAAVGLLTIACVNVANLLLSSAMNRRQEMAIRAALGAGRGRLTVLWLLEGTVLGLAGGVVGLALAAFAIRLLDSLGQASVPRLADIGITVPVMLYTFGLSIVAGIAGAVPAALHRRGHELLLAGARGSTRAGVPGARRLVLRNALVVSELAIAVMLLSGAGLLVRSFAQLRDVAPGFNPANVLTAEITMTGRKYADSQAALDAYRQIWSGLQSLPGVRGVGGVSALPLSQMMAWGPIVVEGRPMAPGESFINVDIRAVAHDYFEAMEIPILAGRRFNEHDTRTMPRVVIVDAHMAEQLWPNQDPVGKRIRTGGMDASADVPWMTVVGVAGRIKQDRLDAESRMAIYHPHTQFPTRSLNLVVRSSVAPEQMAATVRQHIAAVDPDLPLYGIRTMADRVDQSLARRRFAMLLLSLIAGLALILGAVGSYSVLSYLVGQASREFGIRLALGATPGGLRARVLSQGMSVALIGVAAGIAGALVLTRLMRTLVFGISTTDPLTFATVAAAIVGVSFVAVYLPAWRASRIDPAISLRVE